jgi:hypothetical protein
MAEARRIIAKYGIEDWESLKGESDWPEWLESLVGLRGREEFDKM